MAKAKRKTARRKSAAKKKPARARAAAARSGNGFQTMALHAYDDKDAKVINRLTRERSGSRAFAMMSAAKVRAADPETIAQGYLDQAVESQATPGITAPKLGASTSEFKSLGAETIALTGTKTVKFRQYIAKIPVYGSLVTVELDDKNDLLSMNSSVALPKGVDALASVAPADAVRAVKDYPGWKKDLANASPRLNFYYEKTSAKWRLVFILEDVPTQPAPGKKKVGARAQATPRFMDFIVDAHSGKVIAALPRTTTATALVTAKDGKNRSRKFRVTVSGAKRVLSDPTLNVETFDFDFSDPDARASLLPGATVMAPPGWSPSAVSAHANAGVVVDFLRDVLLRNNIDNKGGSMNSSINCVVRKESSGAQEWVNAYWNGDQMVYGQRQIDGRLASLAEWLDIVAHEMFHGVTDMTARLEYQNESGALNESYSDIFGVIVANYDIANTQNWEWRIGDGLDDGGKPFRDMSNPKARGQPAHMRNYRKYPNTENGDYGGVHINSGIHNKAAYNILTAPGANAKAALTPKEVISIFYLALTQQLTRNSGFSDSRRGVLLSARSLFRAMPAQRQDAKIAAVEAGFDAVGIK
jgi:Zn-dependent metalloprotease